jgi:hypothetical protein
MPPRHSVPLLPSLSRSFPITPKYTHTHPLAQVFSHYHNLLRAGSHDQNEVGGIFCGLAQASNSIFTALLCRIEEAFWGLSPWSVSHQLTAWLTPGFMILAASSFFSQIYFPLNMSNGDLSNSLSHSFLYFAVILTRSVTLIHWSHSELLEQILHSFNQHRFYF